MRSAIFRQLTASILMLLAVTLAFGFLYPLVVTGLSQLLFHKQANGSLVYSHGKLVGSALLGQGFTDSEGNSLPRYFQPRPSAAGPGTTGAAAARPTSGRRTRCSSDSSRA